MRLLMISQVVSGEDDPCVHLKGVTQLRSLRRPSNVINDHTQTLSGISTFLPLMARTLSFQSYQSLMLTDAGSELEEDAVTSTLFYEHTYGINPTIVAAIQETCRLAESLTALDGVAEESSVPYDILKAAEALESRLLSWTLGHEMVAKSFSMSHEIMATALHHQAHAWYYGALIYYYHRIRGYQSADLVSEAERVVEHMQAAEDAKARARAQAAGTGRSAPLTWPMFIASCETVPSRREPCRDWWQRACRDYEIVNIKKQWDAIQQVWERMDATSGDDGNPSDWITTYISLNLSILPI